MAFGVYVHIPFCLQRCVYCDFATFDVAEAKNKIGTVEDYIDVICREIQVHHPSPRVVDTLYFGGGTPSLIDPKFILAIKESLSQCGFTFSTQLEWTIEINPATVSEQNLEEYLRMGVNRFSVGVQSFDDKSLKLAGRKHTSDDTRATLDLLKKYDLNFSMDLLFALPHQTLDELRADLDEFLDYQPPHISPYCLTVPQSNPMASNRPSDERQVEMFYLIHDSLTKAGLNQYEISNYSRPNFTSRHNQLYWMDEPYWGVGLSSHSYDPSYGDWGIRYWNPPQFQSYKKLVNEIRNSLTHWRTGHFEALKFNEALMDFCHTALRTSEGLCLDRLEQKFNSAARNRIHKTLCDLPSSWLTLDGNQWRLTLDGQVLSNKIFQSLFLDEKECEGLINL